MEHEEEELEVPPRPETQKPKFERKLHFNIIVKNVCISRKQNVGMTTTPQFQYALQDSSEESIIDGCEPDADRALSIAIAEAAEQAAKQEEGRLREREIQRLAADKAEKRERIRKNVKPSKLKLLLRNNGTSLTLKVILLTPKWCMHSARSKELPCVPQFKRILQTLQCLGGSKCRFQ